MELISVNIGSVQPIARVKSGQSGIFKRPVSGPARVTALGLEGDAIVDTKNHGGYDQAVYVYGTADYDWWSAELGTPLEPGTFGENLTIAGLESGRFSAGDRITVGEVVLEVTCPRIPCATLAARMGDPKFVKRYRKAERPGLYCRVIREGSVRPGDPVTVTPYAGETVTMLEMFRNFYIKQPPADFLRRYLAAPTPARDREAMETKFRKAS